MQRSKSSLALGAVLTSTLTLAAACGGGGGGGGGTVLARAPQILAEPQDASVALNQAATFRVVAEGTGPLVYQWFRGGRAIAAATSSTLSFVPSQGDTAADFRVTILGPGGFARSRSARLTVVRADPLDLPSALLLGCEARGGSVTGAASE